MKNNQPITDHEVVFPADARLITTTDLQGVITFVNDDFVKVSGYERKELLGQHHNIIRHPHMPREAFADMWQTLHAGRSWKGMVKNRCKNGDYYWVDAYVTPILKDGAVVEYQSVRFPPDADVKVRAEREYRRWREGGVPKGASRLRVSWGAKLMLAAILPALILGGLAFAGLDAWVLALAALLLAAAGGIVTWVLQAPLREMVHEFRALIGHPALTYLYRGRTDELGAIRQALSMRRSEIRAVIARLANTSFYVNRSKKRADECVGAVSDAIQSQGRDVEDVYQAMSRMLDGQKQVAEAVEHTVRAVEQSNEATSSGRDQLGRMVESINQLADALQDTRGTVSTLASRSENITKVIDVITSIAAQTNLLSLNAAIEAARAGEAGRGFAVVAEEVRNLAHRTQESTRDIREILSGLETDTQACVTAIGTGVTMSQQTVELATQTDHAFGTILGAVNDISQLSSTVIAAMHEQSTTSEQVGQQVLNMRDSAAKAVESSNVFFTHAGQLDKHMGGLDVLTKHFAISLNR